MTAFLVRYFSHGIRIMLEVSEGEVDRYYYGISIYMDSTYEAPFTAKAS